MQCFGSVLVSIRIRIQIQPTKLIWIRIQSFSWPTFGIKLLIKYTVFVTIVYLDLHQGLLGWIQSIQPSIKTVKFFKIESGSIFPIRIRLQVIATYTDPDPRCYRNSIRIRMDPGPDSKHWFRQGLWEGQIQFSRNCTLRQGLLIH